MPRQILGITRRGVLLGLAAAAVPARALAAPQAPVPQGDDVGFLSFGAVAESVLANLYTHALKLKGAWSRDERVLLDAAHDRHRTNVDRLNNVLGPDDAVSLDDFARQVRVGTRKGVLKVGRELETLVTGVYLNGVGYAEDTGTRLLLGRLLAAGHAQEAMLARLAGHDTAGLPAPIDLDAAGLKLDSYLKDPTT